MFPKICHRLDCLRSLTGFRVPFMYDGTVGTIMGEEKGLWALGQTRSSGLASFNTGRTPRQICFKCFYPVRCVFL
jgi:hypothetical protein